ncbi:PRC-barrel domain-containing protein [Dehalobacter sp. DCM]|uniref:PRC-barrel domain-containing protein n=1 Tax=Dehalobacter sp. DCM TaxID=2907827 RepID=UPI00308141F7|nr:PRC-barrel domain-containing protein [Dehalobacter sp. DCM]
MLPSKRILSLPIISLKEGQQIGLVRNIVIDPAAKSVAALIVDPKGFFKEQRIIPFNRVVSVGENAITVGAEKQAEKATNLPEMMELLKEKAALIGIKVITANGKTLGLIEEFYVDEESGAIACLEISGGKIDGLLKGKARLNADDVLTIGADVVVAAKDSEERLELFSKGINENVKQLFQVAAQKASRKGRDANSVLRKSKKNNLPSPSEETAELGEMVNTEAMIEDTLEQAQPAAADAPEPVSEAEADNRDNKMI